MLTKQEYKQLRTAMEFASYDDHHCSIVISIEKVVALLDLFVEPDVKYSMIDKRVNNLSAEQISKLSGQAFEWFMKKKARDSDPLSPEG